MKFIKKISIFFVATMLLCNIASCESANNQVSQPMSLYVTAYVYTDRPADIYLKGSLGAGGGGGGAGTLTAPSGGGVACCLPTFAGEVVVARIQRGYSAEQEKLGAKQETEISSAVIPEPDCPGESRYLTIHLFPDNKMKLFIRNFIDDYRREDGSPLQVKSQYKEGTFQCMKH